MAILAIRCSITTPVVTYYGRNDQYNFQRCMHSGNSSWIQCRGRKGSIYLFFCGLKRDN